MLIQTRGLGSRWPDRRKSTYLRPELPFNVGLTVVLHDPAIWACTEEFAAASADPDADAAGAGAGAGAEVAGSSPGPAAPAGGGGLHPPYWAVPWVGGQGVARYILGRGLHSFPVQLNLSNSWTHS